MYCIAITRESLTLVYVLYVLHSYNQRVFNSSVCTDVLHSYNQRVFNSSVCTDVLHCYNQRVFNSSVCTVCTA